MTFLSKQKKSEFFFEFVDVLKIGKIHSLFSKVKQKGISSLMLIRIMISLPFIEQDNIHSFSKSSWNLVNIGKDAFYRLKNNPFINWRRFLFNVARASIQTLEGRNKERAKSKTIALQRLSLMIPQQKKEVIKLKGHQEYGTT